MKCALCKNGETRDGKTTVTLSRGDSVIVIKEVPAFICDNCGEYFLSGEVSRSVLAKAEEAYKKGVEVEIMKFVA
ncbi:MAG TPA: type II toxin-antitoxin system MqsA family antitoxin [Spirochaetota bacterium]|nr:type II toxin-antitoxin system MqsA family antitoxin [Spirochaetota bacterium]HPI90770.1 type II toxin-antitoxin system MqsA family antitoxin [Spirochaetota bacterium]HPR48496.1 type II toxin-antitoxin system MqsA family antitoxin [Spirochaetota bacterium]